MTVCPRSRWPRRSIFANDRYPQLLLLPVGNQGLKDGSFVLIEFTPGSHHDEIKIVEMRLYILVPMANVPLEQLLSRASE